MKSADQFLAESNVGPNLESASCRVNRKRAHDECAGDEAGSIVIGIKAQDLRRRVLQVIEKASDGYLRGLLRGLGSDFRKS